MRWLRDLICAPCACAVAPLATMTDNSIPPTSPARLLAESLTDPETRDEWNVQKSNLSSPYGHSTPYRNAKRDLTITRWWALYGGSGISTPFTLNKAEEKLVTDALTAWNKYRADLAEQAALARLTAKPGKRPAPKAETS